MSQTYNDPDPRLNLAIYVLERFLASACNAAVRIHAQRYDLEADVICYLECFVEVLRQTPEFRVEMIRMIIGTHFTVELAPFWVAFVKDPNNLKGLSTAHFNLLADPSILPN